MHDGSVSCRTPHMANQGDPTPVCHCALTPKRKDCFSILHLSDLHFPTSRPVKNSPWMATFENLLATDADLLNIDAVAVTGDLLDSESFRSGPHTKTLQAAKDYLKDDICRICGVDPDKQLV